MAVLPIDNQSDKEYFKKKLKSKASILAGAALTGAGFGYNKDKLTRLALDIKNDNIRSKVMKAVTHPKTPAALKLSGLGLIGAGIYNMFN